MSIAVTVTSSVGIHVPTPIIKATSDTDARYAMSCAAAFIPSEGPAALAATDGRKAAIVPVAAPLDRGPDSEAVVQLPRPALKACKWRKGNKPGPAPIVCVEGSECRVSTDTAGATYPVAPSRSFPFPPLADVLPKPEHTEAGVVLSFNPLYLWELAQALGAEGQVTIIADPNGKRPMVVMPNGLDIPVDNAIGVLMPCSGADTSEARDAAKDRAIRATENARRILSSATARRDSAQRS